MNNLISGTAEMDLVYPKIDHLGYRRALSRAPLNCINPRSHDLDRKLLRPLYLISGCLFSPCPSTLVVVLDHSAFCARAKEMVGKEGVVRMICITLAVHRYSKEGDAL